MVKEGLRKAHKDENFMKRRHIILSSGLPDEEAQSPAECKQVVQV